MQRDTLSCSLFILCMDSLIRKVNGDNEIEGLKKVVERCLFTRGDQFKNKINYLNFFPKIYL